MMHADEHIKNLLHYFQNVLGIKSFLAPQTSNQALGYLKIDSEKNGNIYFVRLKTAEASVFEGSLKVFFDKFKASLKKQPELISTLEFDNFDQSEVILQKLHSLKPSFVFFLGEASKLIGENTSASQIFSFNNTPAICTIDPEVLMNKEELKRAAWEDIKAALRAMES